MKNLLNLYNFFTGQDGPDDCGIACLTMILKYAGKFPESEMLLTRASVPPGGLSLLELRNLSSDSGLTARCVIMDLPALRKSSVPCILHVVNEAKADHFVVCFGHKKKKDGYHYIIGDPATGIYFTAENTLEKKWQSHAALYFEDMTYCYPGFKNHPWFYLLKIKTLRNTLFVSVPLLNIFATILGVALSWLLQRGINDSLADKKNSLVTAVIFLLFIILIFRSLITYLRQRILIKLNREVREKYITTYLARLFQRDINASNDDQVLKKSLNDIQKIQNSVAAILSVLISDGCLVMLLISGLCYFEPFVGLINIIYSAITIYMGVTVSATLIYRQAEISNIIASSEQSLLYAVSRPAPVQDKLCIQLSDQEKVTEKSSLLAALIGRNNLWYECVGAVNVTAVFIFCIVNIRHQQISYNMLMTEVILTYFISALLPKVCNVFPVITDGARLIKRFETTN